MRCIQTVACVCARALARCSWVLAARDGLAAVRGLCEEVTVVAHSTGAPVAAIVAESFPIETLVFTGPNFVSNPSDLW